MSNSDIQRLAQQIYEKHKEALDIIFDYRLNPQQQIHTYIKGLIQDHPELVEDRSTATMIRFSTLPFDQTPLRNSCNPWTKTGRLLLFEFKNPNSGGLDLQLHIGPTHREEGRPEIRKMLEDFIEAHQPEVFNEYKTINHGDHVRLYHKRWIHAEDFRTKDVDTMKRQIENRFEEFLREDLPRIHQVIQSVFTI